LLLDDGGYVAVLPWIDGTTGACDPLTAAGAARALARFQRFAAAESPVARALPWDDLIVALAASIARVASRASQLPHAIVHGDPNPGNVVVCDGSVRGLIDFDFVHESERVYDVGALLDEFARADDDAPFSVERIGALIAAYDAEAPLTADERELLPDAMLRHAATLVWYVVTRHGERTPGDIGGAPRYAARVSEIALCAESIRHVA
jgi:hypothetical protein